LTVLPALLAKLGTGSTGLVCRCLAAEPADYRAGAESARRVLAPVLRYPKIALAFAQWWSWPSGYRRWG